MSKKNRSIIPDTSPKITQREALNEDLHIKGFPWTTNQQKIIDCILSKDSKIVFVDGLAGTGKSSLATYCGLKLLNSGRLKEFLFIRNALETSDSAGLGFLAGPIEQKFEPYRMVLDEKLKELLPKSEINRLWADERLLPKPINYIRGCSWAVSYILAEESNNFTLSEFKLLLTRYGQFSKLILVGDQWQTDLVKSKQGGFKRVYEMFDNQESCDQGIHCFRLGVEDIRRSAITGFIIDKFQKSEKPIETDSQMFPLKP